MKQLVSIILSLLLLVSSSGLTYAQHYCGEYKMMSELTLGEKHLSCGMDMKMPGCDDEKEKHNCCDNEFTSIDTDDNFAKASFEFGVQKIVAASFVSTFVLQLDFDLPEEPDVYKDYGPPILEQDLQVLFETFLI